MKTPDFASSWPALREAAVGYLRRRGVDRDLADDIVQEAGISLFRVWDSLDHERSLVPLVRTVAANRLIDHHRRPQPELVDEFPEICSAYDIEEHGQLRARLEDAAMGFRRLSDRDRHILLGELGLHPPTADRVARMRARKRLRSILDAANRSAAWVPISLRKISDWVQSVTPAEALGAAAATGLLVVISFGVLSLDLEVEARTRTNPSATGSGSATPRKMMPVRADKSPGEQIPSAPADETPVLRARTTSSATATRQKDLETDAGPARAEQGHGQGYVYLQACLGEETEDEGDDYGVTVVVVDGGQNGEEETPSCRYESEGGSN